eukprot:SAG11_NODE_13917_length_633_cov_1.058052_1_plen_45_part_10
MRQPNDDAMVTIYVAACRYGGIQDLLLTAYLQPTDIYKSKVAAKY